MAGKKIKSTPSKAAEEIPAKETSSNTKISKKTTTKTATSETKSSSSHPIEYEFGGPIGAAGVIFGLPFVIFALYFICNKDVCVQNPMVFGWKEWLADR
jgi:hypothetical protein